MVLLWCRIVAGAGPLRGKFRAADHDAVARKQECTVALRFTENLPRLGVGSGIGYSQATTSRRVQNGDNVAKRQQNAYLVGLVG